MPNKRKLDMPTTIDEFFGINPETEIDKNKIGQVDSISKSDVETSKRLNVLTFKNLEKDTLESLSKIIEFVEFAQTFGNTPVYLAEKDREVIEAFLYSLKKKYKLKARDVTLSSLMRICTLYMIKNFKTDLKVQLSNYYKKDVGV